MNTAKQIRIPFVWQERRVAFLRENFLYIPDRIDHEYRPLQLSTKPIHIEYCSGNGQWIVEKAMQNPEIFWVAVEKKFERAQKIWQRGQQAPNLFVVCSAAEEFTRFYCPKIERAFINFPDPWPKRRHQKHRLIQREFLSDLEKVLEKDVTFVSDDGPYMQWVREEFLKNQWQEIFYTNHLPSYGRSYFRDLWESANRQIHFATYQKWGEKDVSGS